MKASKRDGPRGDSRAEWRRVDDLVEDVSKLMQPTSSHGHLITLTVNEGGPVLDCSGLVNALAQKGIDLTAL
jgi:hypothetical protein